MFHDKNMEILNHVQQLQREVIYYGSRFVTVAGHGLNRTFRPGTVEQLLSGKAYRLNSPGEERRAQEMNPKKLVNEYIVPFLMSDSVRITSRHNVITEDLEPAYQLLRTWASGKIDLRKADSRDIEEVLDPFFNPFLNADFKPERERVLATFIAMVFSAEALLKKLNQNYPPEQHAERYYEDFAPLRLTLETLRERCLWDNPMLTSYQISEDTANDIKREGKISGWTVGAAENHLRSRFVHWYLYLLDPYMGDFTPKIDSIIGDIAFILAPQREHEKSIPTPMVLAAINSDYSYYDLYALDELKRRIQQGSSKQRQELYYLLSKTPFNNQYIHFWKSLMNSLHSDHSEKNPLRLNRDRLKEVESKIKVLAQDVVAKINPNYYWTEESEIADWVLKSLS